MTATTIKFTPTEMEIIQHRLVDSDCIIQCILETEGDKFSEDELCDAIDRIEKSLNSVDATDKAVMEVLFDCLDGSTFFANMDDGVALEMLTQAKANAYQRAANSIEKKMEAVGVNVCIPRR